MESIENVDISLIKAKVYSINTYDWGKYYTLPIVDHGKGETRKQRKYDFIDAIVTFDIETTALPENETSFIYIWQCCINGDIIIGRTAGSILNLFDRLSAYLDDKTKVLCYVHNLSYEFHFLREILKFEDVFSISKRHPLAARYKNIEFRCSYLLTNQSLNNFLDEMNVENKKTTMDYSIKRYPWTFINATDAEYCINDVLGLYQAIKEKMRREKDTIYTIPLTSTGYTRREVKNVMYKVRSYKKFINAIPDFELHKLLYEAFRGGNTHANRWVSGKLIKNKVIHSKDIASSYPNALVKNKYPWQFEKFDYDSLKSVRYVIDQGEAALFRITFFNLRLKNNNFGCPYIPISKCSQKSDVIEDNGRVLEAGYITMVITDIDLKIIDRIYKWDSEVIYEGYKAKYDYLPLPLRQLIIKYFVNKTSLKGKDEIRYNLFKARINAIYGLMVQNPCKALIDYDSTLDDLFCYNSTPLEEVYYKNIKSPYTLYQWGVWCTCYARLALDNGLELIEKDPKALFLYCDTDSLKYIGNVDFSGYNDKQISDDFEVGAVAKTVKDETKFLGIYETEPDMKSFITHGAKKYAYEDLDGKLHLTCAGVSKKSGAEELEKIENFRDGFIFKKSAGKELKYNDHPEHAAMYIDGKAIINYSNIYMHESTYTLKKSDKYSQLLYTLEYHLQEHI